MTLLNQDEMSDLMGAMAAGPFGAGAKGPSVSVWDFTNPVRNVPDPMPVLETANKTVGRLFAAALAGRTRIPLRIRAETPVRTREEEVPTLIAPPTVIAVLQLGPKLPDAILLLEPRLAEAIVLAGLGATETEEAAATMGHEPLTALELVVLRRLLVLFEGALRKGYAHIIDLQPKLTRIETDARMALPFCPADIALRMPFHVDGPIEGSLQLLIPFAVFEPMRTALVPSMRERAPDPGFRTRLERHVRQVPISLVAEFGRAQMTLKTVRKLAVDDVITLDTDENSALQVRVDDKLKFWATPTVSAGNLAVCVRSVATDSGTYVAGLGDDGTEPAGPKDAKEKRDMSDNHEMTAPAADGPRSDEDVGPSNGGHVDLHDVQLSVAVLLGRAQLPLEEVLALSPGSIVELDKLAGEPLDVVLNGRLVARGEAVVVGERFGVRVTDVVTARDRANEVN